MSDANIATESEVEWMERPHDEFVGKAKRIGRAAGGEKLGATIYEISPGRRMMPYHYHLGIEEAIYVLDGEGTLRLDDEEHGISAGDYVALPADETGAHQIENTGEEPIRYLCFSTMEDPDVVVYPDSEKVMVAGGGEEGYRKVLDENAELEYWDREE